MSFPQQVYEILAAEAARRMITLQELLRAIIVPDWILAQNEGSAEFSRSAKIPPNPSPPKAFNVEEPRKTYASSTQG